jgi:hypothetical protein
MLETVVYILAGCVVMLAWTLVRVNDKVKEIEERLEVHQKLAHGRKQSRVIGASPTQ